MPARGDEQWAQQAACSKSWVQMEWFFPQEQGAPAADGTYQLGYTDDGLRARLICASCPVLLDCWRANRDAGTGIYAGTDEKDRGRMFARARMKHKRLNLPAPQWSDVPGPSFPKVHVAKPSHPLKQAIYNFLRGATIEDAAKVAELKTDFPLRRAIAERQVVA